ncbi:MAG: S8 family serine peptidase [Prevotella sp.]|nr:S8 family serine peptidase [Prevotella sp.]
MKTTELSTTRLKNYKLTLCGGEAVVRNQKRINGLIGPRKALIPEEFHNLLANAIFMGNVANEQIMWTTDVFEGKPTRLSELSGNEFVRYNDILQRALQSYANAFHDAEDSVRKLMYAAITYVSNSSVFCADNKVVITEWGMAKKGDQSPLGMPMSIDDPDKPKPQSAPQPTSVPEPEPAPEPAPEPVPEPDPKPVPAPFPEPEPEPQPEPQPVPNPEPEPDPEPEPNPDPQPGPQPKSGKETVRKKPKRKKWWLWLLLLLLAIIIIWLLSRCRSHAPIQEVGPDLDTTQIVIGKDSLRYIAGNRLLLLLTKDGVTIEDFAKAFRKHYPDEKKYILSNPDTVIKRVMLTLPADEREKMEEELPDEFADFGLIVIPETMYKGSYESNDPELRDANKRWYFDECSVFDAWDVTMGSEDIVVAIIDDGFDLNHPELKGKVVNQYNAVYKNTTITPSPSGHGTHVAATATGNADNSIGISGIAPKCKLMPIQVGDVQGNIPMSAVMDGVVYAIENGASVVNMSLGMSFSPLVQFLPEYMQKNIRENSFLDEERVWNYLFDVAKKRNVTFVIAGGNSNIIIGLDPMQRSANTIKVSAVQPNKAKASFSNYGDMSTVSAPGVRIYNAVPGNKYTYMDGTSMAAPIVTGGCALLKSQDPSLTVTELVQILRETGNPSSSDVGPIVNFAKALNLDYSSEDECYKINQRYQELLAELDEIRKNHPGCIEKPDTMSLPDNISLESLNGRWKSTTSLHNEQDEEVVIYFTFNGTSTAKLDIVEPDGSDYAASLSISISNDQVFIDQTAPAENPGTGREYNPYRFVLKPDRNRKAAGNAKNKVEAANTFEFNLIKI